MADETSTETEVDVPKTDEEWRAKLTPEQYHVAREGGTEGAFTGDTWDAKTPGMYRCIGCGVALFRSDEKYESGSGWPSFWQPIEGDRVEEIEDRSLGMRRVEVRCATCQSHLGHVFDDGPRPTGLRYCMNSAAMRLDPADDKA